MNALKFLGVLVFAACAYLRGPCAQSATAPWSLVVSTTTPVLSRWEGAVLELRVQNVSGVVQELVPPLLVGGDREQWLRVTSPGGEARDIHAVVVREDISDGEPPVKILAGDSHVQVFVAALDWSRCKPLFDAPGEYGLQVYFGGASSNSISITCAPMSPAGAAKYAPLMSLEERGLLAALYGGYLLDTPPFQGVEADLEAIALSPGGGWYRDYASLALGVACVGRAEGALEHAAVPAVANSAKAWLARIAPTSPLTPIVVDVKKRLQAAEKKGSSD